MKHNFETKTIRLCIVSPHYHPNLGGVGRQAVELSEYLYATGIEVSVLCRKLKGVSGWKSSSSLAVRKIRTVWADRYDLEAKTIVNILVSLSFSFNVMLALIKYRNKYDIVHFHGAGLPLIINVLPLKIMRKKIVAKVAGARMDREAGSFKGRYCCIGDIFIKILKGVDAFVAVSSEIKNGLINDGFEQKKIFDSTNFINKEKFYPERDENKRNEIRKKLGIDHNKIVILFSGRLIPTKRVDILLKATAEVVKSRKDIQVVILGHGELKNGLQEMAESLHVNDYIVFKGFVSNILDYLQASDIFAFTSEVEGMPNSLLEAMACGLPVIATRIGGVVDIVENKKNGLLVTAGDAEELKDAILKLLENEQLSKSLSQEAYRTIRENYYIDKVADKYISLYQRLLA